MTLALSSQLKNKISQDRKSFIITGASGWLGKVLLEILHDCFGDETAKYVFPISSSSKEIELRNGYKIKTYDYDFDFPKGDYVICHFAFLTKDKVAKMTREDYIKSNEEIRNDVAKIIKNLKPKSILYSSSGAAYDKNDIYGILKLQDEKYFVDLASEVKAEIIIPRIFNIAGPYINKIGAYALSDFITQLKQNKKIVISSKAPVVRSYIHVIDLFEICLSWIFDKNKTEKSIVFDMANKKEVELSKLAGMIVNLFDKSAIVSRDGYEKNLPKNYYVGDIAKQNELCKRYEIAISDYERIILDTNEFLEFATGYDK